MRSWWMLSLVVLMACGGDDGGDGTDGTDGTDGGEETDVVDPVDAILALSTDTLAGETVYDDRCALCHVDGSGGSGADLVTVLPMIDDREAVTAILDGKGTMPAYGDLLTDQEIADVYAYIVDAYE